jgi:hypothetical protein
LRPGNFIRRRTDLGEKDLKVAARGGLALHHFINLKDGLDITLNCEINPNDPAGITTPYRILVPALWFDGEFEPSTTPVKNRWWQLGKKKTNREDAPSLEDLPSHGSRIVDYHEPVESAEGLGERYDDPPEDRPGHQSHPGPGQLPRKNSVPVRGYNEVEAYHPQRKKWLLF